MKKKILFGASLLFGVMFINSGLNKFFNYMPMPENVPEGVQQIMAGFMATGWLFPLIAIVEIIAGALFITDRFRALGAVMLLPIVIGIVLFHLFQAPATLAIAVVLAAINVWVIVENRSKYMPMLQA